MSAPQFYLVASWRRLTFPFTLRQRLEEIEDAVKAGAGEIDIVITRAHVLQGNWVELYEEVSMLLASWVRTSTN